MIARWPWPNTEMEPEHDVFVADMPSEPTVDLPADDDEPQLLGPDGHPLPRQRPPVGFALPRQEQEP